MILLGIYNYLTREQAVEGDVHAVSLAFGVNEIMLGIL